MDYIRSALIRTISQPHLNTTLKPECVVAVAPLVVELMSGWWVMVPTGFWCDGASIPRAVRPFLSQLVLLQMGVVHDYAVRPGAKVHPPHNSLHAPYDISFRFSTDLALALAERAGSGPIARTLMRVAFALAAPTFWHRKPMAWRPDGVN